MQVDLLVDLLADLLEVAVAEAVPTAVTIITITTTMLVGRQTTTTTIVSISPSLGLLVYMSCGQPVLCNAWLAYPDMAMHHAIMLTDPSLIPDDDGVSS